MKLKGGRLVIDIKTNRRFFLEPIFGKVQIKNKTKVTYGSMYQGVIIFENDIEIDRAIIKKISPYKAIDKILKRAQ